MALFALSTAAVPPNRVSPMTAVKRAAPAPGETTERVVEAAAIAASLPPPPPTDDTSSGSSAEETSSPAFEM